MVLKNISVRGAREHNLKNVDLDIPHNQLTVITGLSGSGKSSLAFDTIYAEGQRKYVESLSAYARQFLEQMSKPDFDDIEGLPPTIAIEQRGGGHNPRSTVATTTEIYDYLRLLFARAGTPHCWHRDESGVLCGREISRQSPTQIVDHVMDMPEGARLMVLSPVIRGKKGEHKEVFEGLQKQGMVRARVNGVVHDLRTPPELDRYKQHTIEVVIDRLVLKPTIRTRLADSVETALKLSDGLLIVAVEDENKARDKDGQVIWQDHLFSEKFACAVHPEIALEDLAPRLFSFNSPYGACPVCNGLGTIMEFDPDLIVPDTNVSLKEGAIEAWRKHGKRMNIYYARMLKKFCRDFGVTSTAPYKKMSKKQQRILLQGTSDRDEREFGAHFEGVIPNLQRRWESTDSEYVKKRLNNYLSDHACESCHGARLRVEALHVFIFSDGKPFNIDQVTRMNIGEALAFFDRIDLDEEGRTIAEPILKEVKARLGFMANVGLNYLNLNRSTSTLSGGEAQRIRLATQVGSGLVGCAYVLDEPTIGLHQRDNDRLITTLRHLTDIGNTVIVVEHDEDTIRSADFLVDIGPGPGVHGGKVVAAGPIKKVIKDKKSLTAKYLRGDELIPVPEERVKVDRKKTITIKGAKQNNLKDITVKIPTRGLVCVTGVSGSGKSTLVNQIMLRGMKRALYASRDRPGDHDRITGLTSIDRVIEVDQSPIGRTPRSNPATYTGAFDLIRSHFAMTKEAKIRGYQPGRFSFNVKGGRCEACQGQGIKKIEMHFLPDVYVECEACHGSRYNAETLEIRFKGKNIAEVLDMTVEEALVFYDSIPKIQRMMQTLDDVGLGYVKLGQSSTTLSGGEAQRVKLASELGKNSSGHTVYILDEPTTGLHFEDIKKLLSVIKRLVDKNHTVIVIEHNLDVIKSADWIIDLGPEGGDDGGTIVAEGTPEDVVKVENSYTGQYLKQYL